MNALIEQGVNLMLYGMGTVFCFLGILIFAVFLMSYVLQRWFPPLVEATPTPSPRSAQAHTLSANTLKVIQAAVDQHRKR